MSLVKQWKKLSQGPREMWVVTGQRLKRCGVGSWGVLGVGVWPSDTATGARLGRTSPEGRTSREEIEKAVFPQL